MRGAMGQGWIGWAAVAAVGLSAGTARAQAADPAAAQALFDEAMALMKADRFAEACPKLEASLKLDPAMGTEFNLAGCLERQGQIARAWGHFVAVADGAKAAKQVEREKSARQRAQALEPRLPRLTVVVPPAVARLPGLAVTKDGLPVDPAQFGLATPVDPGAHTVSARASGKRAWSQDVQAAERARAELTIPPLEDEAAPPPPVTPGEKPATPPSPPIAPGLGVQRGVAIGLGALGVVGLVMGTVLGVSAKSQWSQALTQCRLSDPTWCYPAAFGPGDGAVTAATGSTVSFALGGAALAAGVITFFTAKPSKQTGLRVVPLAGPRLAGGGLGGRF
jgi:hypothetical protein